MPARGDDGPDLRPIPPSRPRGRLAFAVPLPFAAAIGVATGVSPRLTFVVCAAIVSALVLILRVEWAAAVVVCAAIFESYLSAVSHWAPLWLTYVFLLAWLVRRVRGPLHQRRLLAIGVPVTALVAVVIAGTALHPRGVVGIETAMEYLLPAVVMLVLADVLMGTWAPLLAARIYVMACLVAALCGIADALVSADHLVAGPVADADIFAIFLVAALPLTRAVFSHGEKPAWRSWACTIILITAVVGTQSRPAVLAMMVMLVLAVITGRVSKRHAGGVLAGVITAVALLVAVLRLPLGDVVTNAENRSQVRTLVHFDDRLAALRMIEDKPLTGHGPGAIAVIHQDYLAEVQGAEVPHPRPGRDAESQAARATAHSTMLEAGAELGLVGLLLLYTCWLVPAIFAFRRWRLDRSPLTADVGRALAGLLVFSVLESAWAQFPLWFLAAAAFALGGRTRRQHLGVLGLGAESAPSGSSGQVPPTSWVSRRTDRFVIDHGLVGMDPVHKVGASPQTG